MYCQLITGASGLLGSYLLRDSLAAGLPTAVLVRKSRLESARGRIESILARFEAAGSPLLPRPVVLEGDINHEGLGLSNEDLSWIRRHCRSVVHSAASLSFEADEKTNEPWRSNYEGTRNVLEFLRTTGIRELHHVSTAYVCGLRQGTIYEHEVDVGQSVGNVYEKSKLAAEKLVRAATHLDRLTVHRPAIIVGDSQTGFTTTFHGFYTPLKVVHMLVGKVPLAEMNIGGLLQSLGLTGEERKNFVPVDWVSAAMTRILADERLHGETYHLAPSTRVSVNELTAVFEQAIRQISVPQIEKNSNAPLDSAAFEDVFRTQMETYQSYWRDDPVFDTTNLHRAVPDLPFPQVDDDAMWRLARYAIEKNFGWPVPPPIRAPLDIERHLQAVVMQAPEQNPSWQRHVGLTVVGRGGGEWTLIVDRQQLAGVAKGHVGQGLPRAYLTSSTFRRLVDKEFTVGEAFATGALVVFGADEVPEQVLNVVAQAAGLDTGARHSTAGLAPNLIEH